MQRIETSVLIIGGGPTGLALACDLARRHVPFRIVDKAPAYFIGSKGKGLQPRSLEVMDDFGIVNQVLANGKFHIPMRGYDGATVLGEKDMHAGRYPTPTTPYASVLITPQWRVEEALRGLLERSGGHVDLSTELIHLEQGESDVVATLRGSSGEEQVRCEFLVAADGGKSFVRRFLQVPFEGETREDERMYVGDVRLQGLDRDAWHMWPKHPEGILGLCPLPSTDMFQLQAQVPPGDLEPSFELLQEIVARRTGEMNVRLTEAPWMSLYRVNVRMVSKFRIGRVFLAGDAAHVHTPAGGQGMNTGIQDAYNLGWKLAAVLGGAPPSLLDTYEEERLPVAANVLGLSNKLYKQMTGNDDQLRGDAITLQLGITYREMSLSTTSGGVKLNLSSGDRAPDSTGLDGNGRPLRLFDLFRGTHFTLLRLFPGDSDRAEAPFTNTKVVSVKRALSAGDAETCVFVDADGYVASTYGGGSGECALVRPDGYIGWIGSQAELADLRAFPGLT